MCFVAIGGGIEWISGKGRVLRLEELKLAVAGGVVCQAGTDSGNLSRVEVVSR